MPRTKKKPAANESQDTGHVPVSNKSISAPKIGSIGTSSEPTLEVMSKFPVIGDQQSAQGTNESFLMNENGLLDAYWLTYGTDAERAAQRRAKTDPTTEVVIGTDERQQIFNTNEYPFSCIASLRITAPDGSGALGTGWLVGPRILLTAGHVVYMPNNGGWAQQIEVIPGRDGANFPFGSCIATVFRSTQGWVRDTDANFDYAAILLPPENRFGDQLGWFGRQVYSAEALSGLIVNISGYPGDKAPGTQWWMSSPIMSVEERRFVYTIDTYKGQSGSPVWVFFDGDNGRYGVGVHTNGALTGNSATRFVQDMFDNIAAWANEVP